MELLEAIGRILGFKLYKEDSARPGWAGRPSRMRKSRTPFSSSRVRKVGPQNMHVEEFESREERNDRFRQLRERGTKNVSKFTVSRADEGESAGHIVWCVVRP